MKKAIVISVAAVTTAITTTGIVATVKKNSVKRAMLEEFDSSVKALISEVKTNANVDLQLIHNYENSLIYKIEHNVPFKVEDGLSLVRNIESELIDISYRLSAMDDENREATLRVVSDIMMSSVDAMERDIQRRADARAALASAASTAVNLTGNVATAAVAYASTVEKMEEKKEANERLETKEA